MVSHQAPAPLNSVLILGESVQDLLGARERQQGFRGSSFVTYNLPSAILVASGCELT